MDADGDEMKIFQSYTRNKPSSASGYSITVRITYSSFNPTEIEEIEAKLPKGMMVIDTVKDGDGGMTITMFKCPICHEEQLAGNPENADVITQVPRICKDCREAVLLVRQWMKAMHIQRSSDS